MRSTKFLGLIIDQHLEWDEHLKMRSSKMASGIYAINSVKNILPTTILKTMYYSKVHPYLTYGLLLWGSTYKRHINKIEIVQKRAIRSVAKVKYNEQTLQLFISLSILKLKDLFNLQMAVFMYEYNMDILPLSLRQCFTRNDELPHQNTRYSRDPHIVSRRSCFMCNCFICQAPILWSNLPNQLKEANSSKAFKNQVKRHYKTTS